ncbi:MAG TPA: nuclear transport factor 2 family protein [Gemmatimonadales bacterium]|nr:nuclear transport factor 2 family protein [Gemmatimonadales bacterium]
MRSTLPSTALLALTLGCSRTVPVVPPEVAAATPPPAAALSVADRIAELATTALQADARLESADSLYGPDVEIIADGQPRTMPPRYAGIQSGGQVAVGSTRVDVSGNFAWVLVEYRWLAADQNVIREGRATFVFSRAPGSGRWLIAHAHSSAVH